MNEISFSLHLNKTPLYMALEKENEKIVQLLLSLDNIDVNLKSISIHNFKIKFENK